MSRRSELIYKFKNRINKNLFIKSIIFISGGATIAQIINILFSPIITRLYLPSEYGVMSLLTSVLMLLSVSSLMYEVAIPLEKDDRKAINIFALSFIVLTIFVFAISIILIFWGEFLLILLGSEGLIPYRYYISIGTALVGTYNILTHWMYKRKNFKLISKTQIGQSVIGNLSKSISGLLSFGVNGLLIGTILNKSAGIFSLFRNILKRDGGLKKDINFIDIKHSIKEYKDFPLYQTPTMILLRVKNNLPIFALAFFGTGVVGLYSLAYSIIKLPMMLVGQSVTKVFFAEIASFGKDNPKRILSLSDKLFFKMSIYGFFPILLLAIFGPFIFGFIFGSNWFGAGTFVRMLAIGIYADFIFSPASRVFEVMGKQKNKLFIDIFGFLIVFLSFFLSRILDFSPELTIMSYSVFMSIIYLITYLIAKSYLKQAIVDLDVE